MKNKKTLFFLFLIFSLSLYLHFLHLSYPDKVVFDEQWYSSSAASYFTHKYYFDANPPLGKLLIAGILPGIPVVGGFTPSIYHPPISLPDYSPSSHCSALSWDSKNACIGLLVSRNSLLSRNYRRIIQYSERDWSSAAPLESFSCDVFSKRKIHAIYPPHIPIMVDTVSFIPWNNLYAALYRGIMKIQWRED